MGDWKDTQLQMQAGKEAVKKVKGYFENGISFNRETTLCGQSIMKNIQRAKELGYSVEMYYVGVADVQTAIERVANRVKKGGHGIPDATIEKRYSQSMENFAKAIPLCDKVVIFDNTEQFREIAGYEQGKIVFMHKDMPQWFKQNILPELDVSKNIL